MRFFGVFLHAFIVIFLLTCATPSQAVEAISSRETCEAKGGHWGTSGLWVKEACNLPTKDAGKECANKSDCESACVKDLPEEAFKKYGVCSSDEAKSCDSIKDCPASDVCIIKHEPMKGKGQCYGWTILRGTCLSHVDKGLIQSPLCID